MEKKIKIAHIITRLIIGGAQENTLSTVIELMKDDHYDIDLICGPGLGPEGSMESEATANGVKMLTIPQLRRNIHPFYDITAFIKLISVFRNHKYDIIHTHSSKAGILGRIAAYIAGCPIIIHTIHGLPFHPYEKKWKNLLYIFLERLCAKVSTKIITVSDTMAQKAIEAKIGNPGLYKTIYSGMNIDEFLKAGKSRRQIRNDLGLNENDVVIGKVARLFNLKGHDFVIDNAREIIKITPNVKFLFVGDGILKGTLLSKIKMYGMEGKFIFTGLVSPDKIPAYISAMDILVHASLREGLARAIPQAMAVGLPVVALDVDSAREVVKNGENGFLVDPSDSGGFVNAVLKLSNDKNLRLQMGICAKNMVIPYFSSKYMVEQIDKIYKELLCLHG